VRAVKADIHLYTQSPDVPAGEPLRASLEVRGDLSENDAALAKAAHRALDAALVELFERARERYGIVGRAPGDPRRMK
jgi:hypothetical protein